MRIKKATFHISLSCLFLPLTDIKGTEKLFFILFILRRISKQILFILRWIPKQTEFFNSNPKSPEIGKSVISGHFKVEIQHEDMVSLTICPGSQLTFTKKIELLTYLSL